MAGVEAEVIEKVEVTEVRDVAGHENVEIKEVVVREGEHTGHIEVSVERYDDPDHRRQHFRVARHDTLLHVLDEGARKLEEKLLPNAEAPLDHLRGVYCDHEVGQPLDLELTVDEFLEHKPLTHHFAVELVLAIQVNTRWRVAPEKEMTPKAILELAGLSPQEYSLYFPAAKEPLPPETPVKLHRGERFEAQRDGKYG